MPSANTTVNTYEIYVRALLEYREELEEKRHQGKYHLIDELVDLDRAIAEADLTDKQREALRLSFDQHMRHVDIGVILGVPRQTVDFHVNSAIRKIANIYEQWEAQKCSPLKTTTSNR